MPRFLLRNAANLIVLLRIGLVFLILLFFSSDSAAYRVSGLILLLLAALLDGVDGYIARKLHMASQAGGLLDTLGDRITENLLIIFFACKELIPVWVAILFVARSFCADFVRTLNFREGMSTFQVNISRFGKVLVASTVSRSVYLVLKIILFIGAAVVLILECPGVTGWRDAVPAIAGAVYYGSICILCISLFRFVVLIIDSRLVLKKYFFSG